MHKNNNTGIKFSTVQDTAIKNGSLKRKRLEKVAANASSPKNSNKKFKHTYIFSPPGLGKTVTVEAAIEKTKVPWHPISGNISMFAFGVQLATICFMDKKSKSIVISVDDCDEILKNETNCNIMKNILVGRQEFSYEKSMQSQWSNLTEIQKEAVEFHQDPSRMGFRVPVDRLLFIITSNMKLPTDDDVQNARKKNPKTAMMPGHLNAIRSRCTTVDFDLSTDKKNNEQWGWIADVILNTNCVSRLKTKQEKMILLDWIYNNWDNMNERSIRTAEKMSEIMVEDPTGYRDTWEIDYLK